MKEERQTDNGVLVKVYREHREYFFRKKIKRRSDTDGAQHQVARIYDDLDNLSTTAATEMTSIWG